MPYKVFKVDGGYKVGKKDGSKMGNGRKYASNKPLKKIKLKNDTSVESFQIGGLNNEETEESE